MTDDKIQIALLHLRVRALEIVVYGACMGIVVAFGTKLLEGVFGAA